MNVLFVDDSDTCLAPMACALLQRVLISQPEAGIHVGSAGLRVSDGGVLPQEAEAMARYQRDLCGHTPRLLSDDLVTETDLILTMTGVQLREVHERYPESRGVSFRLTTYVDIRDEIPVDLYGAATWTHADACDVLLVSLIKLVLRLGLSPQHLPGLAEKTDAFTGGLMQQQENAITRCYEAQHRLRTGTHRTRRESQHESAHARAGPSVVPGVPFAASTALSGRPHKARVHKQSRGGGSAREAQVWFSWTIVPGSGVKWPACGGFRRHSQLLFDSGIPVLRTQ